jgi:N-acetyl-D-muramate 6-phosphate phosphatase
MTNTAVLFDLDGTLFDSMPDFLHIFNHMLQARGRPAVEDVDGFRIIISKGNEAMVKNAMQITPNDPEFKTIVAEFTQHYAEIRGQHAKLFAGFEQVLDHFDAQQIPWGIVTNRMESNIAPFLKKFALHERPYCLVGADTAGEKKPHPAPLLYAAKQIGIAPEQCFYVGDFSTDIEAAKAAGMKSVAVAWGYHEGLADMRSWEPDYIIHKPEELLEIVGKFK